MPVMRETFPWDVYQKTTVTYFGQHIYDTIDAIAAQADKRACKERFGLNPDLPVIALGYNASSTQRHQDMLRSIAKLTETITNGLTLVLQVTYGADDPGYLDSLRDTAKALPCRTLFLTDAMDESECAWLRLATDVYVHANPDGFPVGHHPRISIRRCAGALR